MYNTQDMVDGLGDNWCGPERLPHGEEVRIGKIPPTSGDGYPVEIYCTALPAQFFTIKAIDSLNAIGKPRNGFSITTGSGMYEWSIQTAKLIANGMVGVETHSHIVPG